MTQNQKTQQQEEIQAKMMEELMEELRELLKIVEELKLSEKAELLRKWVDTFDAIRGILGGHWTYIKLEARLRDNEIIDVMEIDLGAIKISVFENITSITPEKIKGLVINKLAYILANFAQTLEDVTRAIVNKIEDLEDATRTIAKKIEDLEDLCNDNEDQ